MADKMNEPDWSDSKTLLSECWKNPLHPMNDRLEMADGAIAYRNEIISNLRRQLDAKDKVIEVLQAKLDCVFRTGRKLADNERLGITQSNAINGFLDALDELFDLGEFE